MTQPSWDAVVVGGGPAGLIAARRLAAAGRSVVLVEEHERIGYPVHCTGLLGMDAFDELPLPRDAIRGIARCARFHGPEGEPVTVETEHITAAVIDRGDFDAALAREARDAGVEFMLGTRVETIHADQGAVSVRLPDGTVQARVGVLACGANYRFNRQLGLGVPCTLVQTAQVETPFPPAAHVDVYVGREVAPNGFGWVVPFERDGRPWARIGIMSTSQARDRFAALSERVWKERRVTGPVPQPRLKALPLGPVERTYAHRVLAVGDAAGLVKPTTGGGIYYSLLSGAIAGDVLAGALARDTVDARTLSAYEERWTERLGPDIRAGLAFRRLAERFDDRALRALIDLARVDGLVPLLKRTGDFNSHRAAVMALLRHSGFRRVLLSSLWH